MNLENKDIIIFVNHLNFLMSHRSELLRELLKINASILVIAGEEESLDGVTEAQNTLQSLGISIKRLPFKSGDKSVVKSLFSLFAFAFVCIFRRVDLVHCISNKPIIFGGIVCKFLRIPFVVSVSGIGNIKTEINKSLKNKLLFIFYIFLMRVIISGKFCEPIFQNGDDVVEIMGRDFKKLGKGHMTKGSGMVLPDKSFADDKKKIVILPARVLPSKGIIEFCEAVLKLERIDEWKFLVLGSLSYSNHKDWALSVRELYGQSVSFMGHVDDMRPYYQSASIVCLPSYGEGFPKALIEGSGYGCAIVTTNVPGCRDAIVNGHTGYLVEVKNIEDLCGRLQSLIDRPKEIKRLGHNGYSYALKNFDVNTVVEKNLNAYNRLLIRTEGNRKRFAI